MKKLVKKVEESKLYFSIFIIIAFVLFLVATSDISLITDKVYSLSTYVSLLFDKLYSETYYGQQMIGELFWIILLIPVLFLFKNKYIFVQKQDKFIPTVKKAWPLLIYTIIVLIPSVVTVVRNGINWYELIGLIIFCAFIGIFEELMCRGWIQNEFIERFSDSRNNVLFSILMSSALFGLMHITNVFFADQSLTETLIQIASAFLIGIAYGAVYYKSKNIWVPIFFHGFWDFAVMLKELNFGVTCIIPTTPSDESIFLLIFGIIGVCLVGFPEIYTAIKFLGRKEVNDELPKESKEKLTRDDIVKEKKKNKDLMVATIIILVIIAVAQFSTIVNPVDESELGISEDTESCPVYIDREAKNYTEEFASYDKVNINVKYSVITNCGQTNCLSLSDLFYDYNISINENRKLVIEELSSQKQIELEYDNVIDFLVVENNGVYDIYLISVDKSFNYLVYHSNFMTKQNIENYPDFLNSLGGTFKRVLLPKITKLGVYKEDETNYSYPLFVSSINDKFIMDEEEKIYILK